MRTYRDARGVEWTVWETRPKSLGETLSPAHGVPARPPGRDEAAHDSSVSDAEPRDWWLTFESVREKRRLSPAPAGWQALPDDELDAIRVTGEVVPKRRLVE